MSSATHTRTASGGPVPPHKLRWYPHALPIQTRWKDNDMYGHVNNVQYYSYMDTVINSYLIATAGVLDPVTSPVIGLCITSGCTFHASLTFPDVVGTLRLAC